MNKSSAIRILGLSLNYNLEELKASYKALAKKYHPDVNNGKAAEEKMKEINAAYEFLKANITESSFNYNSQDEKGTNSVKDAINNAIKQIKHYILESYDVIHSLDNTYSKYYTVIRKNAYSSINELNNSKTNIEIGKILNAFNSFTININHLFIKELYDRFLKIHQFYFINKALFDREINQFDYSKNMKVLYSEFNSKTRAFLLIEERKREEYRKSVMQRIKNIYNSLVTDTDVDDFTNDVSSSINEFIDEILSIRFSDYYLKNPTICNERIEKKFNKFNIIILDNYQRYLNFKKEKSKLISMIRIFMIENNSLEARFMLIKVERFKNFNNWESFYERTTNELLMLQKRITIKKHNSYKRAL